MEKKNDLENIILPCFCENHFRCSNETHPEINLGFSTFCHLRPSNVNVLLLKNMPKDQCKCKTHENFCMKLNALNSDILHDKDCWQSILCETNDLQSSCWTGTCETCREGKLLETNYPKSLTCQKKFNGTNGRKMRIKF